MKHVKEYALFESNNQNLNVVEYRDGNDESIFIGIVDSDFGDTVIHKDSWDSTTLSYPYNPSCVGFKVNFDEGCEPGEDELFSVEPVMNRSEETGAIKSCLYVVSPTEKKIKSNPLPEEAPSDEGEDANYADIYIPSSAIMNRIIKYKKVWDGGDPIIEFLDTEVFLNLLIYSGLFMPSFTKIK